MDKLRMVRSFVEVVQHRSFAAAALRLDISPSLVSKQIAELESGLGVRLLSRTTRNTEVTEIGQHYYDACTKMLRDLDAAEEAARDMQRMAGGTVTVRAPHSLTVLYLSRLLRDFSLAYPEVEVNLVVDEYPNHSVLQAQRGLDVAMHLGPFEADKLAARHVAQVGWHLYGSESYLREHGVPHTPADLAAHNCLAHSMIASDRQWYFEDARGQAQTVAARGTLFSSSSLVLRQAAIDGLGLAMLPSFCVAPYGEKAGLVRVLADYSRPTRDLHLLVSPDRRRPRRIRLFIDFALKWFDPVPWDPEA